MTASPHTAITAAIVWSSWLHAGSLDRQAASWLPLWALRGAHDGARRRTARCKVTATCSDRHLSRQCSGAGCVQRVRFTGEARQGGGFEEAGADVGGGGACVRVVGVPSVGGESIVPGPTLPVVGVPTTSGTGSEATPVAVLSDPDRAMKVGISSPQPHPAHRHLRSRAHPLLPGEPDRALRGRRGHPPRRVLHRRRPARHRAPGLRAGVHRQVGVADHVAMQGLELMGRSLLAAYHNPTDATARHDVMLAAFCGVVALGAAGTAATHTPHGGEPCAVPPAVNTGPAGLDDHYRRAS